MPTIDIPIGGGFYQSESLPISAQRCINLYPAVIQTQNTSTRVGLFPTPGQKIFTSIPGICRGKEVMAQIDYAVYGNVLYKINENKTKNNLGTIEGSGFVSMTNNGTKLVIAVPGGKGYVYDGTLLQEITDPDYRSSNTVSFKDGFFLFTASDGTVFFNSTLGDPLNVRALDFGTAEINPDRIMSTHVTHNELFVIGRETIELFQNVGGADFPFQRIGGANIQKGSHATFGVTGLDESFAFVGGGKYEKTGIYQVASSSVAVKISTPAIDLAIQEFSKEEISNCRAISYFERGNQIALFIFESEIIPNKTFGYNFTASRQLEVPIWFEFQSGVNDNGWDINSIVLAYGKLLAGTKNGDLVELDKDFRDDLGGSIKRQFTAGSLTNSEKPIINPKITLWLEAGVGEGSGQGKDPSVSMDFSDNGKVFGNDRIRKIGKVGKFGQQTEWRRNPRVSVFRVIRFTITDPIKVIIRKLQVTLQETGPNV